MSTYNSELENFCQEIKKTYSNRYQEIDIEKLCNEMYYRNTTLDLMTPLCENIKSEYLEKYKLDHKFEFGEKIKIYVEKNLYDYFKYISTSDTCWIYDLYEEFYGLIKYTNEKIKFHKILDEIILSIHNNISNCECTFGAKKHIAVNVHTNYVAINLCCEQDCKVDSYCFTIKLKSKCNTKSSRKISN